MKNNHFRDLETFLVTTFHKRIDEVNRTVTEAGIKLQGACEQFRSQDEDAKTKMSGIKEEIKEKNQATRDEVAAAMRKEIGELLLSENKKNDNKLGKLKAELKKEEKKQNTELGAVEKDIRWIQKKIQSMEMEKKEDKKKIIELEEEVRWLIARNRKAECDLCGRKCNTAWGLARHIVDKHTSVTSPSNNAM